MEERLLQRCPRSLVGDASHLVNQFNILSNISNVFSTSAELLSLRSPPVLWWCGIGRIVRVSDEPASRHQTQRWGERISLLSKLTTLGPRGSHLWKKNKISEEYETALSSQNGLLTFTKIDIHSTAKNKQECGFSPPVVGMPQTLLLGGPRKKSFGLSLKLYHHDNFARRAIHFKLRLIQFLKNYK